MTKKKKSSLAPSTEVTKPKRRAHNRTPDFHAYPEWSESKFWAFIRSGLRAKFSRWPPKYTVLNDAKRPYKGPNKKQRYEYKCSECKKHHLQKDVEVDHIIPCGSLKQYEDLAGFVERMFCGKDGLRVVCKPCHKSITAESRKK